jgi:hypothetical protein
LEANQHGDFAFFQRPASAVLRWTTFSAGRRFTLGAFNGTGISRGFTPLFTLL